MHVGSNGVIGWLAFADYNKCAPLGEPSSEFVVLGESTTETIKAYDAEIERMCREDYPETELLQ